MDPQVPAAQSTHAGLACLLPLQQATQQAFLGVPRAPQVLDIRDQLGVLEHAEDSMNLSEVLRLAKETFQKELESIRKPMLLADAAIHILRAAKNDTDLANKAINYMPTHLERFDQAIANAEAKEKEEKE